ncbi:cation-translocating P-type ATPase [Inconstantimicrobium mannanitabidum]|uniref:Carbonate dehydratase n=1 Tax=Inconstantimicrobium mannanitabidum TaxID=1604901 RepID=A0ACB5RCR2_9CLOT|nr:cation-translocating P-type ATPase [Clostridium sp. TW13]GKX67050.1 carbonate dehydratase [Clostridium sp. TW13]
MSMGVLNGNDYINSYEGEQLGLSEEEVKKRIKEGKVNQIPKVPSRTIGQIIWANVFTLFNGINVVLALLVILAGSPKNAIFAGVIISNAIIGVIQELRAKKTIEKLTILARSKATVIRDGVEREIDVEEIVLDDLIFLKSGCQIPVDAEVLPGSKIEVNEALLTGESDYLIRNPGEQLLSGSFVGSGSGYAVVTAVGANTYSSKLSEEAKRFKKINSELQNSINKILSFLIKIIVPTGLLLTFTQMYFINKPWQEAVIGVVAGISGMIPEGLVLLTSVTFVVSIVRLSKYNTLIQELPATEVLARVDVLCLDKTGTITEGKLKVIDVKNFDISKEEAEEALSAVVHSFSVVNPTQEAILERYNQKGNFEVTNKISFSSSKKWSAVEFEDKGAWYLGAPEILYKEKYNEIKEQVFEEAERGRRVLLLAKSPRGLSEIVPADLEKAALIIIEDIIRPEAPDTLKFFDTQGVDIKIISGDNPVTVAAVAKRAGVKNADKYVVATDLPKDKEEFRKAVRENSIFGRVTPHQKKELVKALQADGHTVAMTGDGINDVLALKEADCGIAMASGSDATKAVAQLVLLDSNFASLPKVVQEGRRTINNLELAANLYLTKTVYAVILSIIFALILLPFPYEPIQLSLVGSLGIGIPSFFIALQPNEDLVQKGFLTRVLKMSLPNGIVIALSVILVSLLLNFSGVPDFKSKTICTLIIGILSMLILLRVSEPLTKLKVAVCAVMIGIFCSAFVIKICRRVFSFSHLNFYDIVIVGTCILAAVFCLAVLSRVVARFIDKREAKKENKIRAGAKK